ncbi:MAG: extracellular solute-binding protein [Anaerolineae bacterium]|nr:extracellular solute-binding protein [Anaerolineae bacterium]
MRHVQFKFAAVSLLAVLLLTVAFAASAQDPIELQMTWWGSQNRHDRTIKVIETYEAANPGIDIVYEFANFTDYWTKVNTQAAGGQMACVMQQDYAYLSEWANRGLLMPLNTYFEDGTIDVSNVGESILAGGQVGDSYYGLSLGTNSQSIILDVDAFERAGLELPSPDWTWAEFEETALALKENLGIWAITSGTSGLSDIQLWKSLMLGYGELPFALDGSTFGYTDDAPLTEYFNMILRLQDAGAISTPEEAAEYTNAGPEGSQIVVGKSAMQYQWSNQVVAIFSAGGEDRNFKLWHLPRPEGGQAQNYLKPSMFFSITEGCANPEEAAKFINYFTNDLAANEVLFAERGVPISTVVREHLTPMLDPVGLETFDFIARVEADSSPIFPPDPPGFSDFYNNVYTPLFVDPVLYKQISVEEGVALLRQEGEAILAQNE